MVHININMNKTTEKKAMYLNKVEICGVNTSKLVALKGAEKKELLKRVKEGDETAREKFINGNLKLVLSVIHKFTNRGESMDDLFQIGCIGLIKAIDNFDLSHDVQFSTYAVPMIIGEIRRYLRDNNSIRVSRSIRDLAYRALKAKEELTIKLQRDPLIEEIAKELDMPKHEVTLALEAIVDPISLCEPVYSDNSGDAIFVMDQIKDGNNNDDNWLDEISLKESIRSLGKREKQIISLRFFDGKTQMEVANEIGILHNEMQYKKMRKLSGYRGEYEFTANVSYELKVQ